MESNYCALADGVGDAQALAGMQVSLNNLLELITETKQIPDIFSHLEILKKELDEIKSFKEDKF